MRRILFDVLEINIAVSLAILLVCLFEKKLCKRYGAGCLKVVWVILAIRLLIPYNFSLPFTEIRLLSIPGFEQEESVDVEEPSFDTTNISESLQLPTVDLADMNNQKVEPVPKINVETENVVKQPEVSDIPYVSTQEPNVQAQPVPPVYDIAQKPTKANTFSYATLLAQLWLIGTAAGLCYFIICSVSFYNRYSKSLQRLTDTVVLRKVNDIQEEMIGRKRLGVYESAAITSPMLIGLVHTKLVFPTAKRQWQEKELEYIVFHEIWHYRNKDLWLKLLMLLVWCLNWWNPFILLMKRKCFFYMELACDECVLKELEKDARGEYAEMLLCFAGKRNPVSAFSTNFGSGKKRMKQRLDYALGTHKHKKGTVTILLICLLVICAGLFISCGYKPEEVDIEKKDIEQTEETTAVEVNNNAASESIVDMPNENEDEAKLIIAPAKEDVLAMREKALEGMSSEEIARLKENIKVANQTMENAYFYENLFGKLEDPQHLYWNYIDQKGDIQIGWESDGTPIMEYNRFHADNFIALMAEMRDSLKSDLLVKDFNNLIQYMQLSKDTHRVEYVERVYHILHDMDYFLLRYGIEEVGKYLDDLSTVEKYYGVLEVYGGAGLTSIPTPAYLTEVTDEVYRNLITRLIETHMPQFGWAPNGVYYAIMDIDGDGQDELIIKGAEESTAAMATMAYDIYDYNRITKEVYMERRGWPYVTFYDNGYIREEASRNHGRSELEDFWPYHLLVYNAEKDQYEDVAKIDAWQKERWPENFPEAADKDGDGIVYYTSDIMFDTPNAFMDQEEYDSWCEQYNTGKPKEIHWKTIMTLEEYVAIYMKDAVG